MSRLYGHKWSSGFGETDDGTWLRGLRDMTPTQLGQGLQACLEREDTWPPTLPEFRGLCCGSVDPLRNDPARIAARLPYEPAKVETEQEKRERIARADKHLANCREALRKGSSNESRKTDC